MNRATAVAIAVAAVLGITGGSWLAATVGAGDTGTRDAGATADPSGSKSPSKTPTRSPTVSSPAQLLFMDAGRINDGYTHIEVEGFVLSTIDNLVRIRGGWLVIQRDEPSDPNFHASKVAVTGEVTDLGDFIGAWDISLDGDLFTALRGNSYIVIDLAGAEPLDLEVERPEGTEPTAVVSFAGQTILTGWIAEDGTRRTLRTQIASGRSQPLETGTLTGWVASPGGLLIAGQVSNGAISCLRGGGLTNIGEWWTNCQWTLDEDRPKYSANGEQLLVVPLDPDGASPETYGVLRSGSGDLIATVDAPRHAIDAEWGDNNEIFVLARKSARNPAGVLWRCQVGGDCTLERPPNGPVVLGAGV